MKTIICSPRYHWASHHKSATDTTEKILADANIDAKVIKSSKNIFTSFKLGTWASSRYLRKFLLFVDSFIVLSQALILYLFRGYRSFLWIDGSVILPILFSMFPAAKQVYFAYGSLNLRALYLLIIKLGGNKFNVVYETDDININLNKIYLHKIPFIPSKPLVTFNQNESREYLGIPKDKYVLYVPGTIRSDKDYDLILELVKKNDAFYLLLAGRNVDQVSLNILTLDTKRYTWINRFIDSVECERCFAAADIVVLPYDISYNKGSGAIYEALSRNSRIVASRCPTFMDVSNVFPGLIYHYSDLNSFEKQCYDILKDKAITSFDYFESSIYRKSVVDLIDLSIKR